MGTVVSAVHMQLTTSFHDMSKTIKPPLHFNGHFPGEPGLAGVY